jgi:hypothetical protein
MKLDEFKKLENTIQNQDFNRNYKNINQVMLYLSIFGQFASIFLAYFLVSKVLASAINSPVLVSIASVILLGGLELLKREVFDKFSLNQLKTSSFFSKDVLPLLITSTVLISLSFYSSLKGAEEFSSKADEIEIKADTTLKKFEDSLTLKLNSELGKVDTEITSLKSKIDEKDKEQTQLESVQPLNYQQRNRVKDLKDEKTDIRNEIRKLEESKKELKNDLSKDIEDYKNKITSKATDEKKENKTNSFLFIVISTLIEILILSGVYFNQYYIYRSYDDYRKKIEKDPNFQKWVNYNIVLDVIFSSETKINDRLPSNKTIQELCKVNGLILLNKDMIELSKLFVSLGIVKTSGSSKYISKTKENTQEVLRMYFKID